MEKKKKKRKITKKEKALRSKRYIQKRYRHSTNLSIFLPTELHNQLRNFAYTYPEHNYTSLITQLLEELFKAVTVEEAPEDWKPPRRNKRQRANAGE